MADHALSQVMARAERLVGSRVDNSGSTDGVTVEGNDANRVIERREVTDGEDHCTGPRLHSVDLAGIELSQWVQRSALADDCDLCGQVLEDGQAVWKVSHPFVCACARCFDRVRVFSEHRCCAPECDVAVSMARLVA